MSILEFIEIEQGPPKPRLLVGDDVFSGPQSIAECLREMVDDWWRESAGLICDQAVDAFQNQRLIVEQRWYGSGRGTDACDAFTYEAEAQFLGCAPRCDSPIEQILLAGLVFHNVMIGGRRCGAIAINGREALPVTDRPVIQSQAKISQCSVDFLVSIPSAIGTRTAHVIECDGKEYHGTWKARRRDEWRDYFVGYYGLKTIRISGTEITSAAQSGALFDLLSSRGIGVNGAN